MAFNCWHSNCSRGKSNTLIFTPWWVGRGGDVTFHSLNGFVIEIFPYDLISKPSRPVFVNVVRLKDNNETVLIIWLVVGWWLAFKIPICKCVERKFLNRNIENFCVVLHLFPPSFEISTRSPPPQYLFFFLFLLLMNLASLHVVQMGILIFAYIDYSISNRNTDYHQIKTTRN